MKNQLSIIKYTIIIVLLIILAIPCRSQIQPTGCYSSVAGSKACGVTWIETDNGVENSCVCNCNVIPPMVCTPVGSSSGSSSSGSGSAVVLPFPVDPGGIDIDGDDHGKPFFTSGQSDALEEWGTEYKMFQDLYGNVNALQIPLTGDFNLDMFYFNQSAAFNPPAYINNVNGEIYATDANGNRINNEKGKTVNLDEVGETPNSEKTNANVQSLPNMSSITQNNGIENISCDNTMSLQDLQYYQHLAFVGLGTIAGVMILAEAAPVIIAGGGIMAAGTAVLGADVGIAEAISWGAPVVEEGLKAIETIAYTGQSPDATTIAVNMITGEQSNIIGTAGTIGSVAAGGALLNSVNQLNQTSPGISKIYSNVTTKVANTFNLSYGITDAAKSNWEAVNDSK